jgi:hypothetical protein
LTKPVAPGDRNPTVNRIKLAAFSLALVVLPLLLAGCGKGKY